MANRKTNKRKFNKKKVPMVLGIFSILGVVFLAVAYILALAQSNNTGSYLNNKNISCILAACGLTAVAVVCLFGSMVCAFIIKGTTNGKYDDQIFKFVLISLILSGLALIFVSVMTAGRDANIISNLSLNVIEHYNIFTSFYTLFFAGAAIFATLSSAIVIRHSYKIKVVAVK